MLNTKVNVLITGGTGFLGRGILRRAARENWGANFTIYSRDEFKQDLCKRVYPNANYVLGDVRDADRLETTMLNQDIVIHAAALKYVPEAESNVSECVDINVLGTRAVLNAARRSRRVNTVVGISTDKAVEPLNTYGITKSLMERLFHEAARLFPGKRFNLTRYGNVIGSTGSVVPVFQRQAAENNTLLITDPTMTRFWIGVESAIDLIINALAAESGTTVIPYAKSMRIGDVAKAIAPDARVKVTGLRPGEKRFEKLLSYAESPRAEGVGDEWWYNPYREPLRDTVFEISSGETVFMSVDRFRELALDAESV